MIKEVERRNHGNDYSLQLKSYIANDRIVPDDVVIDLVTERLSKPDCRLNGWILDGCPFNMSQIKLLQELKIEPQKVIALEISDEAVLSEVSNLLMLEIDFQFDNAICTDANTEPSSPDLELVQIVGVGDRTRYLGLKLKNKDLAHTKILGAWQGGRYDIL